MNETPDLGPTGEFPFGEPLAEADKGGIRCAISKTPGGNLRIDFGTAITFLIATPGEGVAFANALRQLAISIDPGLRRPGEP